jgi:hypothetical protein
MDEMKRTACFVGCVPAMNDGTHLNLGLQNAYPSEESICDRARNSCTRGIPRKAIAPSDESTIVTIPTKGFFTDKSLTRSSVHHLFFLLVELRTVSTQIHPRSTHRALSEQLDNWQ